MDKKLRAILCLEIYKFEKEVEKGGNGSDEWMKRKIQNK